MMKMNFDTIPIDDFFRSPRWEEILSGLVQVKRECPALCFMMQVDVDASSYANVAPGETETAKHRRSRRFVELAAKAGCYQAFVGIESLNPDNLNFATKYQNTDDRQRRMTLEDARRRVLEKYRRVVDNWHKAGVAVHAEDTAASTDSWSTQSAGARTATTDAPGLRGDRAMATDSERP